MTDFVAYQSEIQLNVDGVALFCPSKSVMCILSETLSYGNFYSANKNAVLFVSGTRNVRTTYTLTSIIKFPPIVALAEWVWTFVFCNCFLDSSGNNKLKIFYISYIWFQKNM